MEYYDAVNLKEFAEANRPTYTKKSWVPHWLWNLVADMILTPCAMKRPLLYSRGGKIKFDFKLPSQERKNDV